MGFENVDKLFPGGSGKDGEITRSIMKLNIKTKQWEKLDVNMTVGRQMHAVSIVEHSEVSQWCPSP